MHFFDRESRSTQERNGSSPRTKALRPERNWLGEGEDFRLLSRSCSAFFFCLILLGGGFRRFLSLPCLCRIRILRHENRLQFVSAMVEGSGVRVARRIVAMRMEQSANRWIANRQIEGLDWRGMDHRGEIPTRRGSAPLAWNGGGLGAMLPGGCAIGRGNRRCIGRSQGGQAP